MEYIDYIFLYDIDYLDYYINLNNFNNPQSQKLELNNYYYINLFCLFLFYIILISIKYIR